MSDTFEAGMTVKRGPGRPRKSAYPLAAEALIEMDKLLPVDMKDRLQHWAYRLELAVALKAGVMDSDSRHLEVIKQKEEIMTAIADEMRAL